MKWLLDHGADPQAAAREYGSPLKMLVCTYSRNAKGKNACLEVFADAGFDLPDTPATRGMIRKVQHLVRVVGDAK